MTFETRELSRAIGDPVALYFFRYGTDSGSYYAYTDADHEISAPGSLVGETVVYIPRPIMRGNIVSNGTLDRSAIELRMPHTDNLADLFRIYPPSQVVTCVIRQGHLGETSGDYPAVWSGRIIGMAFESSEAVLNLEPVITSLRRTGLRRQYQFGCPHVLYGDQCLADKPSATVSVNITSATSNTITMPAAWYGAISVNKYLSGLVEWTNDRGNQEIRNILQISGGKDLVLNGPVTDLTAGHAISVSLGCNRQHGAFDTVGDCKNLHNNINNFGGQPWIPFTNPIGTVSPYY